MRDKYLPIGTVVLLKGGKKRAMITGFCSVAQDNQEKIYDYSGCVYPEGYLSSNQVCLFDHDQIEKIFFLGFEDEEEFTFKEKLNRIVSQIEQDDTSKRVTDTPQAETLEVSLDESQSVPTTPQVSSNGSVPSSFSMPMPATTESGVSSGGDFVPFQ